MAIKVEKVRTTKVGKVKETVFEVTKGKGDLTINDVKMLKAKILEDALKKNTHADVQMIKVLAGQWTTFTSEEKMNSYFESAVADVSKFLEFTKVQYYVQTQ